MRNALGFGWILFAGLSAAAAGQEIESVGPMKAFDLLKNPSTFLVDVRSVAEYVLIGHPDQAFNVPITFWSETGAAFEPNEGFIDDLKARFKPDDTLIFICRSGGRSLRAAQAARKAGFAKTVNIVQGFEGEMDDAGHRTVGGWRNSGLPWTYKIDLKLAYAFRPAPPSRASEVCVMRTDLGAMVFELFDADAPKTVGQFKDLVRKGFYDGKDFYRVVRGHVIQAGGGDAPKLPPEFNARPHVFGTLGMGRTGDEWSGDSEIYVCVAARPYLDGKYTVFGRLISRFDVLERIAAVPVEELWADSDKRMAMHKPIQPIIIRSAKIETGEIGGRAESNFPLIRGLVVRYFFRDPAAAERFYGQVLGLIQAGPGLIRVSETTFLRISPASEAGDDASAPKTATLSFVTDEVDGWFAYLKSKGVTMRSELKDATRHPTRGFVAIDPEGHLLEFERFLDNPQNSRLHDALRAVKPLLPAPGTKATRPGELGIKANILWLYYRDIPSALRFAEDKLSAGPLVDQGFAKVMTASLSGFIGLVDGAQGLHPFTERKAVRIDLAVDDPKAWAAILARRGVSGVPGDRENGRPAFLDAGGYIFRFIPARDVFAAVK
jgi:cyclophilin family peptidyl-prolyl cis-trans isomerase/rhodanese-related sulfurtransferase/catechol 2,3-dioxygenase-like lactoylglutathione lyase family enzyme